MAARKKRAGDATPRCTCGKPAVFFRRYEGRHYCKTCFCESIERKVKKTIGRHRLIAPGDRIAVGLSGGKDSATVLYLLHRFFGKRRDISLVAVSIDEGIAGYRPATLEKARELCARLGVKHIVAAYKGELGATLDRKMRQQPREYCTFCGVGRRYLLNKAAREAKATKLCVGHNLDDEAQAALMNFLRGDLLRAGRMTAELATPQTADFIPRIKPLRSIPEREVALYALLKELPFSDLECPYARGMRFDVRDFLNEMERKHPGTKFAFLESHDKIVPAIAKAVRPAGKLRPCRLCGEPASHDVCKACQLWKT
ncbi:MAG: TIGR00269 family protein [Candidatus Aenigmarchaeota archaeon]|nr:TIGR00269 family protein [Candidatus Aenigmarchaeota archaeon]